MKQVVESLVSQVRCAYGFVPNTDLTARHNAIIYIGQLPTWFFFNKPTHMAYHDLTDPSTPTPRNIKSL